MGNENSLLSPNDLANEQVHKDRRDRLYKIVTELKKRKTPQQYIKKRSDGFFYTDFAYMVEEMDKFHPHRKEDIEIIPEPAMRVIRAVAVVTDLQTGETRTGVDAHRITFNKGFEGDIRYVVDIGNDCKSAAQEALRNAYSRFGVSADVYRKQLQEEPTAEQQAIFDELTARAHSLTADLINWWDNQIIPAWRSQTRESADEFLKQTTISLKGAEDARRTGERKTA